MELLVAVGIFSLISSFLCAKAANACEDYNLNFVGLWFGCVSICLLILHFFCIMKLVCEVLK